MLSDRESLKPSLGLRDALVLDLGAIIGAGVFVVMGILAGLAGPALVVSIVIAAAVALLTARSFIRLTEWQPAEGGTYECARRLITPIAGFLAGWIWMISNLFGGAAVALSFASDSPPVDLSNRFTVALHQHSGSADWLEAAVEANWHVLSY